VYDQDGNCVSVPSQPNVPYGAKVASYPVREADGLVWVWLGTPGRAGLHRVPELPWLAGEGWSTVSGEEDVLASFVLLHENFADVTQVPFIAPEIAPSVLGTTPPPLEVVVSETSVSLHREFPAAPLPEWQAEIVGCPLDTPHRTEQSGFFPSPAVWVDHWDAQAEDGSWVRLRFTHLVTPIDESSSRLLWAVSRDFALGNRAVDQYLEGIFTDYYDRVIDAMEIAQEVLDLDGPGPEVNVNADAVGLKIREIVAALLVEEGA
jgi:vanillate O-demethylase monooxygenase subunit